LVTLNQALAFKGSRHDGGVPVAAIAFELANVAWQASDDELLELF
jgi:hypothetical protein